MTSNKHYIWGLAGAEHVPAIKLRYKKALQYRSVEDIYMSHVLLYTDFHIQIMFYLWSMGQHKYDLK